MNEIYSQPTAEQVRNICAAMTDESVRAAESMPCCHHHMANAVVRLINGRTASGEVQSIDEQYITLRGDSRTVMIPYHSIMYISTR